MNRQIIRFRATAGENQLVGVHSPGAGAEDFSNADSRLFQGPPGLTAGVVLAGRVAVIAEGCLAHGVGDLWQDRGGRVVVEVNRGRGHGFDYTLEPPVTDRGLMGKRNPTPLAGIPILLLAIGRRYDPPPHGWGAGFVILS
jgi:hypothetical protein